ncbi:hypothetical protein FD967_10530 [Polynucleobacter sp. JS-Mosq-20-D10]|uniref:surface-adhesin E family protein n=1 Tax=Polynucleobacter sp. JS-Mosq-20-D10 TaxID=2576922 RepID=UPI001BFED08A|nr:surface-adhesin E family protein [Polynucleobacter sp. JS-Mosq-20-D10]QWE00444.1 hypothetical protein FD967_10530 [Polynucleobacter sp. JS-Mosq-20-D10]
MKKSLYITLAIILATPFTAYLVIQCIDPSDPDLVYVKKPSLFSGAWQKVAYSDNFSEYIEPKKMARNLDSTVDIVTMRNYFKPQLDDDSDKSISYKSQVSYETIDCFNQTVTVTKMYRLSEQFTKGSLIDEPIEPVSTPIRVNARSIGFSKIRKVCELSNLSTDPQYIKSSFMNSI